MLTKEVSYFRGTIVEWKGSRSIGVQGARSAIPIGTTRTGQYAPVRTSTPVDRCMDRSQPGGTTPAVGQYQLREKKERKKEKKRDNLEIQRRSPSAKSIVRGEKKPWEGFAKRISFNDREEKKTTFLLPRVGFSLRLRGNVSSPHARRRNASP
ncbi:hypothetical protein B296_00019501 [Ensete ventricosum]|uniref:Uncharacterized protein n=1 Tax=Ensete ventricosum TaxID=4639 RepID=A0A427A421_ENSVE|nr:hypothetical protein B296_00019501 [Ensete ventricosum]